MFERYTDGARRSLFFARYEAGQRGSPFIESEHLLVGVTHDGPAPIAEILAQFDVAAGTLFQQLDAAQPVQQPIPLSADIPFSPEVKRVLQFAQEEADRLDHRHIGPEHLLLGLLRERHCVAASILSRVGVTADHVRKYVSMLPPQAAGPATTVTSAPDTHTGSEELRSAVATIRLLVDRLSRAGRDSPEAHLAAQIYRALDGLSKRPSS